MGQYNGNRYCVLGVRVVRRAAGMYFHWGLEIDTEMSFVSVEASGTRSEIGVVVDPNAPW